MSDYSQIMEQVTVTAFKADCFRFLEKVRQTGEPLQIVDHGRPLAIVCPPPNAARAAAFGAMRATLTGPAGDLVEPLADVAWDASGK
ncbi:MAG: type II toxin-antitoxin system Phd/YefM family antitoxin [Bryobacterales bacterium]|nr:type II toxin-antitoxin system Phd/YefM family antitoxin [Bryobacterales bacterium]